MIVEITRLSGVGILKGVLIWFNKIFGGKNILCLKI